MICIMDKETVTTVIDVPDNPTLISYNDKKSNGLYYSKAFNPFIATQMASWCLVENFKYVQVQRSSCKIWA